MRKDELSVEMPQKVLSYRVSYVGISELKAAASAQWILVKSRNRAFGSWRVSKYGSFMLGSSTHCAVYSCTQKDNLPVSPLHLRTISSMPLFTFPGYCYQIPWFFPAFMIWEECLIHTLDDNLRTLRYGQERKEWRTAQSRKHLTLDAFFSLSSGLELQ